jgi:aryl-alcohol dehydrogenase-like predicted oxidoreductase
VNTIEIKCPRLGTTDQVSALGYGCSQLGSFGNTLPIPEQRALLEGALELGISWFDTASIYGQGDSERELGLLRARNPGKMFVVTKYGGRFSTKMKLARPIKPLLKPLVQRLGLERKVVEQRTANLDQDFSAANLHRSLEASRRNLRQDVLDVLLMHSPSADQVRNLAFTEPLREVLESGKARHVGVSVDDSDALLAVADLPWVSFVQAPPEVLNDPVTAPAFQAIRDRGGIIIAREIVVGQPGMRPADAVREALRRDAIDLVVVRTTKRKHLEQLAAAAAL